MNELEKQTLRLIGENVSTPDVFTDDDAGLRQIRESLCDAVEDLNMVSGAYVRSYPLSLVEGQQVYRLNPMRDYFVWVVEAWDRSNKRKLYQTDLFRLAVEDPHWLKRDGPPLAYAQLGFNHLAIYMRPSADGTILELTCAFLPQPYTSTNQTVKLKPLHQRAAVYLAVSEFYASRGDAKRAQEYLEKYLETGEMMKLHPQYMERQYQMGGYEPKYKGFRFEQNR